MRRLIRRGPPGRGISSPVLVPAGSTRDEFAIRVRSIDDLFVGLQAGPVAERVLDDDVRYYLLDEWEHVRKTPPSTLTVYAPASERYATDEEAVATAIRADLHRNTQRLHKAFPLSRRDKIAALTGIIVFLVSIFVSTLIEQESSAVLVAGIGQAIVVVGWVALWPSAQTVVVDLLPHHFDRRRYAEFADIELRFVWQETRMPDPAVR